MHWPAAYCPGRQAVHGAHCESDAAVHGRVNHSELPHWVQGLHAVAPIAGLYVAPGVHCEHTESVVER